ncbi:MAG TPA: ABC transporter permease [Bryobacteraceae bacterium]|jgi:ABC-type polysaccharide/polyol phosphate export permease|nr:ABC transporter permease [Bryobacteraceae bacterium]
MSQQKWKGDYLYLLQNLVLKDFRIRYRNMSLGILWSVINPLVMMAVLTFVFGRVFGKQDQPTFPLFVLCGLVPFNFFTGAFLSGTTSITGSAQLVKRVPVPREMVTIAAVFSNCIHLLIQVALLLGLTLAYGLGVNRFWIWMVPLWLLYVVFVCGISLISSAVSVFIRDTQYLVESFNLVLFYLVPIFYSFEIIPPRYAAVYRFNPVAALVLAMRNILLDHQPPPMTLLVNMVIAASLALAVGLLVFGKLKRSFYEYI